ncbi:MAG: glycosyltransferase family 4 protein [Armatimonadota bacterium]
MRIAMVSSSVFGDYVGGVTNYIRFMANELSRKGHQIALFKPVWEDEFAEADDNDAYVRIIQVNMGKRPYDLRRWTGKGKLGFVAGLLHRLTYNLEAKHLEHAVLKWNPDLVWQHDFSASWLAVRKISRKHPVALTNHLGEYLMLNKHWGGRLLLRGLLRHYGAVIGPSSELTPNFHKNSRVIHNGTDTQQFQPPASGRKAELKQKLFGCTDRWVVLCPRRWAPTKGIIFLAEAIRELDRIGNVRDNFMFVLAGSDYAEYPKYAEKVDSILDGVTTPVLKLGNVPLSEMADYYQASDLVVIPSLMEAVSLAALEAMASGVPVLATNVGGLPEVVFPNKTGYLVEAGDSTALGEAILYIQNDPHRDRIAKEALEMVRTSYAWSTIAGNTEKVLFSICKGDTS